MAFNFNWSPLIADTSRAREMLTAALNKSPKPPIIVDDIIVTELNLGSVPPELEILEIGDLAEDRFRGIFKMSYTGDAFLTLKTRVQANPFNTYLSAKPSFASPQPLAASSGLTIPLQITLSDIRLSGFVILVFSRQKGLTLVFRNDPLESLKVSSTFDSIAFVRDYLQREIEGQLRNLFMEDLPAILHRLSLRLWSPEYREMDDELAKKAADEVGIAPVDPLAGPPQDPVDFFGNPLDSSQVSSFALNSSTENHASFSQKNLLRLAALTESHRTLSLFTPSIRDTVFRAWAGSAERNEHSGTHTPLTSSSLSRIQSTYGSNPTSTYSLSGSTDSDRLSARPPLSSSNTSYYGSSISTNRLRNNGRTKKKRIVNLRSKKEGTESDGINTETTTPKPSVSASSAPSIMIEDHDDDLVTPPRSPNKVRSQPQDRHNGIDVDLDATPRARKPSSHPLSESSIAITDFAPPPAYQAPQTSPQPSPKPPKRPAPPQHKSHRPTESRPANLPLLRSYSLDKLSTAFPASASHSHSCSSSSEGSSGGILEQAWMLKMAAEISRKVREEKQRVDDSSGAKGKGSEWDGENERRRVDETPPPAYAV